MRHSLSHGRRISRLADSYFAYFANGPIVLNSDQQITPMPIPGEVGLSSGTATDNDVHIPHTGRLRGQYASAFMRHAALFRALMDNCRATRIGAYSDNPKFPTKPQASIGPANLVCGRLDFAFAPHIAALSLGFVKRPHQRRGRNGDRNEIYRGTKLVVGRDGEVRGIVAPNQRALGRKSTQTKWYDLYKSRRFVEVHSRVATIKE